jgi:hypothetical protein
VTNDRGYAQFHGDGRFDAAEIAAPIRPDATDTRDRWYERHFDPAALPFPVAPDDYRRYVGETWHQRGEECTGFALAAIANHSRLRQFDDPALPSVSRRMLSEVAQLHDGEEFQEGSTLRGAHKGWSRTGVARDDLWPYDPDDGFGAVYGTSRSRGCSMLVTARSSATDASPASTSRPSRTHWHRAMRCSLRPRCTSAGTGCSSPRSSR